MKVSSFAPVLVAAVLASACGPTYYIVRNPNDPYAEPAPGQPGQPGTYPPAPAPPTAYNLPPTAPASSAPAAPPLVYYPEPVYASNPGSPAPAPVPPPPPPVRNPSLPPVRVPAPPPPPAPAPVTPPVRNPSLPPPVRVPEPVPPTPAPVTPPPAPTPPPPPPVPPPVPTLPPPAPTPMPGPPKVPAPAPTPPPAPPTPVVSIPDMPDPSVPTNGATLHLQKTPCGRGQCPTFRLYVYPNGRVEYVGERNAARMGTWERRITVTEVNRLRNRFEQMGFWQLKARYDGNVQDISGVYLSYAKGSRIKQVLNRDIENPPAAFPPLVAELEALVSSGEWTQPGTPTSPAPTPITAPRPADEAKPVAPTKPGQQPAQPTMVPTKERRTRRE